MTPHSFARIDEFTKKKVLVVGDVMLDEYIEGTAERISPEAPIPVLLQKSVRHVLGGAGNVAANVASLGGSVTLVGVVATDARGKILASLAREKGIVTKFITDGSRPTTTKIRFVSGHHQVVRIDIEESHPLPKGSEARLIRLISSLPQHDIVIVSDYAKGVVTKNVMAALKKRFGAKNIIADMKPSNVHIYRGILAITPNVKEAAGMTGIHAHTDALASRVAREIARARGVSVVLTRGEHGITVYGREDKAPVHMRAHVHTVRDVTGAGDTLIAVFALAYASGAPFGEAARLANMAAGIVVGVGGTHALTREDLERHLVLHNSSV